MNENNGATTTVAARLENFWYHYKWHSITAIAVIIAIVICSVQMCRKESYDGYVLYAGGYGISRTSDGDVAEYVKFLSAFKKVVPDTDEDREIVTSFVDLYLPTPEEMAETGSDLYALTSDNFSRLKYEMLSGSEYYICFLSEYNYNEYKIWDDVEIFTPLADYVPAGVEVEYYDANAIYLSSLTFYGVEGINKLPPDTLICLRRMSAVASAFNKGENERNRECAEKILTNILAYTE